MSISYRFVFDGYDIHTLIEGRITVEDLGRYFSSLTADERFARSRTEIVELRAPEFVGFDFDALSAFANDVKLFDGTLTATAVVADGDLPFGIARMYQTLSEAPGRFRVFRDLDTAVAWLGSMMPP